MPTSYTAKLIDEGSTLKEFILRCSKVTGALSHMRDESLASEIRLPELRTYHKDKLKEVEKNKKEFFAKTVDERKAEYESGSTTRHKIKQEQEAEKSVKKQRLLDMAEQVKAWEVPDESFDEFKLFMLDQIEISLPYEFNEPEEVEEVSFRDYDEAEKDNFEWELNYHRKEWEKTQEYHKKACKWVTDLLASVENLK